mmetsp:Transcript_19258/g.73965  ORF Transcript_19258/g.73965 Transcript_19258/m.73965 type:complete len:238 (-) Transcript_19258:188-901(-)
MDLDRSLDEMIIDEQPQQRGGRRGNRSQAHRGKPYGQGGSAPGEPSNRVYVGNLSWQTSWQDLKDHMRQAGNVVYADVFSDDSGRSKGCGIVEYAAAAEAQEAIRTLNDTTIKDTERLIFVREDREARSFNNKGAAPRSFGGYGGAPGGYAAENTRGRQIFVGNLPYTTSWQDLKDHFRVHGNVIRADALIGADGRPKGQGTVLFETAEEAERAIRATNETEFQGRIINVHDDKYAR